MVARLKILAGIDPSKRQTPHDGSFAFKISSKTISVRLSIIPTISGESVVVRFLFGKDLPSLKTVGLDSTTLQTLSEQLKGRNGMILLSGPTGSGKSTTLYASLLEVHRFGKNVITVEDPVELAIKGIVQVQVREDQGLDYPTAIRSVLRHDPDCILIGEIRDALSAKIATESAITGHLTLSSVHTRSVLEVVPRFLSLGIPAAGIVEALSMVINQRLLPRLCSKCKVVDLTASRAFHATLYQRVGCSSCEHSGFSGRVLVTEALIASDDVVKGLLIRETTRASLLENLPAHSFFPWSHSLQRLLIGGDISASQFGTFLDEELGTR